MFFLVDAFTDRPFLGNPAGVCVLKEYPSSEVMQNLGAYFNWSEISFIKEILPNKFRIRWFTPLDEAPLCGHATLAASHVIFTNNLNKNSDLIEFVYNEGVLYASVNKDGSVTMSFPVKPIEICKEFPFNVEDVIGIKEYEKVYKDDLLYVVVLKRAEDVFNAVPNFTQIMKVKARAIVITAKGFEGYDFCSRYFAPSVGIYEDPVCGSAHCRLTYYWREVLGKSDFIAYQASKRTGVLKLSIDDKFVKITAKSKTVCSFDHIPI